MKAEFVIDCSVAMSWCFADERTANSVALLHRLEQSAALVPAHWPLEVANVLAMAEKRDRITPVQSSEFVRLLQILLIQIDPDTPARAFEQVLPIARTHGPATYDAAYLDLAHHRRLPLATLDKDLRAAARKLPISLIDL